MENWDLDIKNGYYMNLYKAYTAIKRVISGNTEMILSPEEFINKRPMYVLNTSKHKEVVIKDKTNMKTSIEFNEPVVANTLCYILLLGGKYLNYLYY